MRVFEVPLDDLFAAFTDADALAAWWIPRAHSAVVLEHRPVEGGRSRLRYTSPTLGVYEETLNYRTVEKPTAIKFRSTPSLGDDSGHEGWRSHLSLDQTWVLGRRGGRSLVSVSLHASSEKAEEALRAAQYDVTHDLTATLLELERLLAGREDATDSYIGRLDPSLRAQR